MNQNQPLFSYQQKPKKVRFRTNHTKEQSIALRKQLLLWIYTNRNHNFQQTTIANKCIELKICRNLHYYLYKTNILIKNEQNTYSWNPSITSPDFDKLIKDIQQAEKNRNKIHRSKNIKKLLLPDNHNTLHQLEFYTVGKNQISEINQKLDLICKALGLC